MATYTKETALYDTNAISDDIGAAGETASKFITEVGSGGIKVHPDGDVKNYTLIDGNGMEIYQNVNGTSTKVADFDAAGTTIGNSAKAHSVIDANGQRFYASNGTTQLANIGYGEGSSESGTATAPYYTFGTRKSTTTAYSSSKTYKIGDLCLYGSPSKLYVCKTDIETSEDWNSSHWQRAIGNYSFTEGVDNIASGYMSHAEGTETIALKSNAHAEGNETIASGTSAHAEGNETVASGRGGAHAEGYCSIASGAFSHAEGNFTEANGDASHAEGNFTKANGDASHAGGSFTVANQAYQTVIGFCNKNKTDTLFEIGNGDGPAARSNAFEVDTSGNVHAQGNITGDDFMTENQNAFDAKNISSGSWTQMDPSGITLQAGHKYLIIYGAQFASNATGYRGIDFGLSADSSRYNMKVPACSGVTTKLNAIITVNPATTQTYHMYAVQNSGSALQVYGYARIIKLV